MVMKFTPSFQQELEARAGMKLQLKINNNRSTMLSVRWEPDETVVSLHKMFLRAPRNVMESLACYLRREHKNIAPSIKYFIEENVKKLDHTHLVDQMELSSKGNVYDLQKIYNNLNAQYFDSRLKLKITWFGKSNQRNRSRTTFGLYHDPLKLIKIHRMMDVSHFPEYVVAYVVYHEMLHNVCPSYHDDRGIHRVHSKEFKAKETEFQHYHLAQNWIKGHHKYFFKK